MLSLLDSICCILVYVRVCLFVKGVRPHCRAHTTFLKITFSFLGLLCESTACHVPVCVCPRSGHRIHNSSRDSLLTKPIFNLDKARPM